LVSRLRTPPTSPLFPYTTLFRSLGAIAVMYIEVNDGNAIESMCRQPMGCRDGYIVKNTKAHGLCRFGMMPGGAHVTEDRIRLATHHHIYSQNASPCGVACSLKGTG